MACPRSRAKKVIDGEGSSRSVRCPYGSCEMKTKGACWHQECEGLGEVTGAVSWVRRESREKKNKGGDVDQYFVCYRGAPRQRATPGREAEHRGRQEEPWRLGCTFEDSKPNSLTSGEGGRSDGTSPPSGRGPRRVQWGFDSPSNRRCCACVCLYPSPVLSGRKRVPSSV